MRKGLVRQHGLKRSGQIGKKGAMVGWAVVLWSGFNARQIGREKRQRLLTGLMFTGVESGMN